MSAPRPSAPRFLIVDPLPAVQNFARQLLESQGCASNSIHCCGDTQTAWEIGRDFGPDLLLSDWFAKAALQGIALHQRLRKLHPRCRLALLGYELTPAHDAQAREAAACFLLRKPFTAAELAAALQKALTLLRREAPPIQLALPALQRFKPGDKVLHRDRTETIQYVLISHGELSVQFHGRPGLVPARELRPK